MVFILCIGMLVPVGATEAKNERQEYLVGFKGEINQGIVRAFGVEEEAILKEYTIIPTMLLSLTPNQAQMLSKHPKIDYVEANEEVSTLVESKPITGQITPWGITRIQASIAHTNGYKRTGVRVGIMGAGIDNTHVDLNQRIYGGHSVFTDTANSNPFYDGDGYGTHIAGVIAAQNNSIGVIGVAPESQLYSIKIFTNDGSASVGGITEGIEWAVVNNMAVLHMSPLGVTNSSTIENACSYAYNAGLLLVAPVGGYPAAYSTVMSVGSIDSNNQSWTFSSDQVDVVAPGVSIYTTLPVDSYGALSGNYLAAAHVSGAGALVKGAKPTLSGGQIANILNITAENIGDSFYGNGVVQVMDAINYALSIRVKQGRKLYEIGWRNLN